MSLNNTPSLVLQLQEDSIDKSSRISDLLRKAKLVANKLDLPDINDWVESELSGYQSALTLPNYRIILGQVKYRHPFYGWQPLIVKDRKLEISISTCRVFQSIASIEEMIGRENGSGCYRQILPGGMQSHFAEATGMDCEFQLHLNIGSIYGILDSVRNNVLDWACKLEKSGILGEGLSFSNREKKAATEMNSGNVFNIQGNIGFIGDANQSNITNTQNLTYNTNEISAIKDAIRQIESATSGINQPIRPQIEISLAEIKNELSKPEPNPDNLRRGLNSLKTTCEGAAGNLIASGIISLISPFI